MPPAETNPRIAASHRIALALAVVGGSVLIAWTALNGWKLPRVGADQLDYYNLLTHGFQKGTLALDIDVPPALLKLANPWDPAQRSGIQTPGDTSYFNGHFYLYFGVAPVIVLFWPFRALTGHDLPSAYSEIIFGVGGFLVAVRLWLSVVRDRFPRASLVTRLGGIMALGLAGGQLVLARRPSMWELPIAAGHFFAVCMALAAYRALRSERPLAWLAAAGMSLGLAIGSRPVLAAGVPALAWIVAAVATRPRGDGSMKRRALAAVVAAGLPLAVVCGGLLAYNEARFGNPLEFGLNYQLSGGGPSGTGHFSPLFAPFNFRVYFLHPPQLGRYFPYFHPSKWIPSPKGYYGTEYVYGAFIICPVLWWSALAAGPMLGRRRGATASFSVFMAALAIGTTAVLLCFDTAAARYETDFLPWWLWLGALGWAWTEDCLAGRGALISARILFGAGCAASCFLAFCASAELHGVLRFRNPGAYVRLSRIFDAPAALAERFCGFQSGTVEMQIAFPKAVSTPFEPLVVTGVEYERDGFFVLYTDARRIQLGYQGKDGTKLLSPVLGVEAGRSYGVRFDSGSLHPPEGHPIYDGWTDAEVRSVIRCARIEFDGRTVLDRDAESPDPSPESIAIGRDGPNGPAGTKFTGIIGNVRRLGTVRPPGANASSGEVVIAVTLPADPAPSLQPLVVAGRVGRADIVGVRILDAERFALSYESWGIGLWESEPMGMPPGRNALFRIRMGSILGIDETSPLAILRGSVVIWMGGVPVWWHRSQVPLGPEPAVSFLSNTAGSSATAPFFKGRLQGWRRSMPEIGWRPGPFRAIEFELGGTGTGRAPLVAVGPSGWADMLAVEWLEAGQARLIYDHWGGPILLSKRFDWSARGLHRISVELPSFASLDGTGPAGPGSTPASGRMLVVFDGRVVWDETARFYRNRSDTVAIGRNVAGHSTAGPELTCAVVGVRQVGPAR